MMQRPYITLKNKSCHKIIFTFFVYTITGISIQGCQLPMTKYTELFVASPPPDLK